MPNLLSALSPIAEPNIPQQQTAAPHPAASRPPFEPLEHLRRQPWIAAAVFFTLFLVGAFFLRSRLGPSYSAEAVVYVSPTFPHELTDDHEHDRTYDQFIEQQIYGVTRYENLKQAIEKYRSVWAFPGEDMQSAIARLQHSLKVEQMGRSYQMAISLQSPNRKSLAEFVNQITAGYLKSARNDEFFGRDDRIATLTADRQRLSTELDAALAKQDALLVQLGIARFDTKSALNPYDTQLQRLHEQLAAAHEKRAEAEAQFFAIDGAPGATALQQLASAQTSADPSMVTLETQLNTRRAALMLQMNGLTPQNPLYIQSQADLNDIDKQLQQVRAKATVKVAGELEQKLSTERDRAVRLESQLSSDLTATQSRAAEAAPRLLQAQILSDDITRIQASYAAVDSRISGLALEGNSPGSEHIVSWALPPSEPLPKHKLLLFFGLAFASLLGAIVAAFIADQLDPSIYTANDIHRLLGFPPIGLLLDEKDFSGQMASEYILRVAGGIDQAHRRTGARTFVFTSAGLGETRDVVRDIGSELANNGLNTLVIYVGELSDLHETTGFADRKPSFSSLPSTAPQAFSRTVGPVGASTDFGSATTAFQLITVAPQGVAELMRRSRISYNTVLIAAHPLLTSAHTEYLCRAADGTVLVAESGSVSKKQLTRVARLLERLKISGIAIILSQIPKARADKEIADNAVEYTRMAAMRT